MAQLVARDVWDVDAAGSNPVTPTNSSIHKAFEYQKSRFDRKIKAVSDILTAFLGEHMITKSFIENILYCFDELGYQIHSNPKQEDFEKAAEWTLIHTAELSDAILAVKMYRYCLDNWDKIKKMFLSKANILSDFEYEGRTNINVVSDEDSFGTYFITNGINKNSLEDIFIASNSFDDDGEDNNDLCFNMARKRSGYAIFEDGMYYIQKAKMSSTKMKLFDSNNRCITNIVLSEDFDVFLENNSSPYDIVLYEGCIGIYRKDYLQQLIYKDNPDQTQLVADIEWDLLDKNEKAGVAKVNLYKDEDIEMILLFAASTFLLFNQYLKSEKRKTIFSFMLTNRIRNM